jgi:hypothetical protein
MIIEISYSIRFFLLIMALILTGVSQSFWLMYSHGRLNSVGQGECVVNCVFVVVAAID